MLVEGAHIQKPSSLKVQILTVQLKFGLQKTVFNFGKISVADIKEKLVLQAQG